MSNKEKTNMGRVTPAGPNLQNIPIRTEEGRRILDILRSAVKDRRGEHRREEKP